MPVDVHTNSIYCWTVHSLLENSEAPALAPNVASTAAKMKNRAISCSHNVCRGGCETKVFPGLVPNASTQTSRGKQVAHNGKNGIIREFRENEMKKNTKKCSGGGAHGGCFQDLEFCEIKFAQGI